MIRMSVFILLVIVIDIVAAVGSLVAAIFVKPHRTALIATGAVLLAALPAIVVVSVYVALASGRAHIG
jgi:hypothetical protein